MASREKQAQEQEAEQRATVVTKRKANPSKGKITKSAPVAERAVESEQVPMASVPDDHDANVETETDDPFSPDAFNERHHGIVAKKETRKPARKTPATQKDAP
jgi:hypothetical protein